MYSVAWFCLSLSIQFSFFYTFSVYIECEMLCTWCHEQTTMWCGCYQQRVTMRIFCCHSQMTLRSLLCYFLHWLVSFCPSTVVSYRRSSALDRPSCTAFRQFRPWSIVANAYRRLCCGWMFHNVRHSRWHAKIDQHHRRSMCRDTDRCRCRAMVTDCWALSRLRLWCEVSICHSWPVSSVE